jgi:DNA-binding CsgD family transcriptional regulator
MLFTKKENDVLRVFISGNGGLTYKEIAYALDTSESVIKARFFRLRAKVAIIDREAFITRARVALFAERRWQNQDGVVQTNQKPSRKIDLVLGALTAGCRTSGEIARHTGIRQENVCNYLYNLLVGGEIVKTGQTAGVKKNGVKTKPSATYARSPA